MLRRRGRPAFWRWTTQTQMVTKSGSRIIVPEQPASLQLRDDTFNEDFEGTWKMCRQDHKSISSIGGKPFFQDVRNLGRGATHGPVPSCRCCNIVQVAKCHVFTTRTIQEGLRETLPKIRLRQLRARTVQIIRGNI